MCKCKEVCNGPVGERRVKVCHTFENSRQEGKGSGYGRGRGAGPGPCRLPTAVWHRDWRPRKGRGLPRATQPSPSAGCPAHSAFVTVSRNCLLIYPSLLPGCRDPVLVVQQPQHMVQGLSGAVHICRTEKNRW